MAVDFLDYDECQWKEMIVAISGADVTKVRGVRYGVESDDEALHAAGDEPISIQSGNKKYTGSFKFLKGALDALQVAAKAAGAKDITGIRFTITVTYLPAGERVMMTDTLGGCKISKWEKGWEQGAKYMDIDVPINFLTLTTLP
jgi:ribosomal protein S12